MILTYRRFFVGGRAVALSAALVAASLGACSGTPSSSSLGRIRSAADEHNEPQAIPMPHEDCVRRGGDIQEVDVNGDGSPDVRTVRRDGRLFCRESDANFDGRVDITRFFDEQGQTLRVEDDYDFDGRIDMVQTYRDGQVASDVLDTNFDGRTDTWRDYRGGRVSELRRDANSDGRIDFWETYNEQGVLVRTAVDQDGDGEPDPPPAAPTTNPTPSAAGTTVSVEARPNGAPGAAPSAGTSAATGGTAPAASAPSAGASQ